MNGQFHWTKLSFIAAGAGLSALMTAVVLLALILTGAVGEDSYDGPGEAAPIVPTPRELVRQDAPTPTALPPPPSAAPIDSLAIPKFDLEAPIIILSVDDNGVMETPDGPTDVAWYDFSARPGFPAEEEGGNSVFAGHVDYYNYGPAVFWHLKDLERDDVIEVRLGDGTVYRYAVVSREQVNAATAPVDQIVGRTPEEMVTLITCGGTFNPAVGEYGERVVVQAVRVYDDAPEAVAGDAP